MDSNCLVSSDYDYADDDDEEDYIDMEVSCHQNVSSNPTTQTSPPHPTEFEFQMFWSSSERDETAASPADELFYKGKLLPLHLPPRFQTVVNFDEFFATPLATTPASNTPFESCNVSPSESCHVSRELSPDEYSAYSAADDQATEDDDTKRSWTRKLKLARRQSSSLGSKIKASRAYIKSLFTRSGCSAVHQEGVPKAMESDNLTAKTKPVCEMPIPAVRSFNKEKFGKDRAIGGRHRRSFSGAIRSFSMTKKPSSNPTSSSSSSSSSSSFVNEPMPHYERSSEAENPIQSAIAHCKRSHYSQQISQSRKTISNVGFCALSASRIVTEDQERQEICRG